ncbi:MAG: hypothetical protein WBW71_00305, partial [Bacteroidota bacterium]
AVPQWHITKQILLPSCYLTFAVLNIILGLPKFISGGHTGHWPGGNGAQSVDEERTEHHHSARQGRINGVIRVSMG